MATEERKIDSFLGGLNPQLRCALSMFDFTDFQTLVDKAFIAEREHKLISDNRPVNDNKRKFEPKKGWATYAKGSYLAADSGGIPAKLAAEC